MINPNPVERFPEEQFVHVPGVVVFAEHETEDSQGRPQKYDKQALQAIVDRCNYRIEDTGDYAVLVKGHTPDDPDKDQPDVLGFVGNYRLGVIGNKKPRYAIVADEWHYAEKHDETRRLPRRSVEVWMHPDMGQRFFDPIAALGAETPRLDLGVKFAKSEDGHTVEKYSAVAPAGANTFTETFEATGAQPPAAPPIAPQPEEPAVPTGEQLETTGQGNQLPPAALQQIVAAFNELDFVQWAKSKMAEDEAATGVGEELAQPGAEAVPGAEPAAEPAAPAADPPMPGGTLEPEPQAPGTNGGVPQEEMMAGQGAPLIPAPEQTDAPPPPFAKPQAYAAAPKEDQEPMDVDTMEYEGEAEDDEADTADSPADEMDYEAADEDDLEVNEPPTEDYECEGKDTDKEDYMADDEDEDNEVPMTKQAETTDVVKMSRQDRQAEREKYRKLEAENKALREEVDKYQKDHTELSDQVQILVRDKNDAQREKALQELYQRRSFDLDAQLDKCLYSRGSEMGPEAFQAHLDTIAELASPSPVGQSVPMGELPTAESEQYKKERDISDAAMKYADDQRRRGNPVTWETALAAVEAAN